MGKRSRQFEGSFPCLIFQPVDNHLHSNAMFDDLCRVVLLYQQRAQLNRESDAFYDWEQGTQGPDAERDTIDTE